MAKKKVSISEIASTIEADGIGESILSIIATNTIKDEDLADMWARAKELLLEIQEYVEDNADDVDDSDVRDPDGDDDSDDDY
jgi:predicted NACHT family NTPase